MIAVYIEWLDHTTFPGWAEADDVSDPHLLMPIKQYSMGWIVNETKDTLTLTTTVNPSACCDPILILKSCIVRRVRIRHPKLKKEKRKCPIS